MRIHHSKLMFFYITFVVSLISSAFASDSPSTNGEGDFQTYEAQGVVEKVAQDHHQMTIHHQAIPNYMSEMTMDFTVKNPEALAGISAGDKITFLLTVGKDTAWIDGIKKLGHTNESTASTTVISSDHPSKLIDGDQLPDGDFVTEDGNTIHFSDFRGKVLAFTFFFTRCPLPDYCPLMNRDFVKTREILLSSPDTPKNWQLLSLSFDGEFDDPKVLSTYAKNFRGDDQDHWIFGTASNKTLASVGAPLGLMIMRQGENTAHNLRTIVLDTHGRIYQQFNGNQWTPQELAQAIKRALETSSNK